MTKSVTATSLLRRMRATAAYRPKAADIKYVLESVAKALRGHDPIGTLRGWWRDYAPNEFQTLFEAIRTCNVPDDQLKDKTLSILREFATASSVRAATETDAFVQAVKRQLTGYGVKVSDVRAADNRTQFVFQGKFDKNAQARDVKRFGGLGGRPVTVTIGWRSDWLHVTVRAFKDTVTLSRGNPGGKLQTILKRAQSTVKDAFDNLLQPRAAAS
jgi:hypothetical protein